MPIIPTVFRPIRANDYQQRTFKAYKNYRINSTAFVTSSGFVHHNGVYFKPPIHVSDPSYNYPVNTLDDTNQHVIWHSLNHRYYAHPHDPVRSAELTNASLTTKNLYKSASALIFPFNEVGERVKAGSVTGIFTNGHSYTLQDDGNGNLRDHAISTSSFASSSRNILHLSFNKEFEHRGPIETQYDTTNFNIVDGPTATGVSGVYPMGYSFKMSDDNINNALIRIPHEDKFNRFNRTDDWTISFWHYNAFGKQHPIISKGGIRKETYLDPINSVIKTRDSIRFMPGITGSYENTRTPFIIGVQKHGNGTSASGSWNLQISDGTEVLNISSSGADYKYTDLGWKHICIRNSNSLCQFFIDGIASGTSGSLPIGVTANRDDIIIGRFISGSQTAENNSINNLAELRMYDYAISDSEITSLSNRHYLSGSLFQTNIAGNIFYRTGEMVVSSPMSKYNTGSGAFGNTFNVSYKGTHTIYENEVLVRVPKDQFNVSMNPSATITPATNKILSVSEEKNSLPGDHRKSMFISGTVSPYISTIGLYNDAAQLVAVSKLAQPIQKRDDVDMNFIVRWDY
jgi:hypothetical protein